MRAKRPSRSKALTRGLRAKRSSVLRILECLGILRTVRARILRTGSGILSTRARILTSNEYTS